MESEQTEASISGQVAEIQKLTQVAVNLLEARDEDSLPEEAPRQGDKSDNAMSSISAGLKAAAANLGVILAQLRRL